MMLQILLNCQILVAVFCHPNKVVLNLKNRMAAIPVVHDTPQNVSFYQLKLTGWKPVVLTVLIRLLPFKRIPLPARDLRRYRGSNIRQLYSGEWTYPSCSGLERATTG